MNWHDELKENITTVNQLLPKISLSKTQRHQMEDILEKFPMSITSYYLSLIDFSDKEDPILKMAIPSVDETDLSGSFDTSGEASNTVIPGLQHKYHETVLMLSTNACAMYCRYCFRKRLVGLSDDEVACNFPAMEKYIKEHKEVSNVLVSGGDALMNSNKRLRRILELLADIDHLDYIRIGSRIPVVFPSRITTDDELLSMLSEINKRKQLVFVTQFNHRREITEESTKAIRCIQQCGLVVRNQAVLLKGVNNKPEVLGDMLRGITSIGIQPYYVFQCRPVKGVKSQFQVPLHEGWEIVNKAKAMQNGLGKSFRYCMSHVTGKLEILGPVGNTGDMLFQYHEAKDASKLGTFYVQHIAHNQAWLDDTE